MADSGRTTVVDDRVHPFSLQAMSAGIERTEMTQHLSVGGIVSNPEFVVQSGSGMISLSESYFEMRLKAVRASDSTTPLLTGGPRFRPECLLPELLWSDVDIYLNSTNLSDDNGGVYPWKAMMRMLLTEGEGSGDTQGGAVLSGAQPTPYNNTIPIYPPQNVNQNIGGISSDTTSMRQFRFLVESRGYTKFFVLGNKVSDSEHENPVTNGSSFALYAKMITTVGDGAGGGVGEMSVCWQPQEGFWQQPNYIPASSDLRVTLQHGPVDLPFRSISLTSPTPAAERGLIDYASSSISLWVRRYHLTPALREQISARLTQGPMHYPFTRARMARVQLSTGQLSVSESALLQGQRPGIVGVAFLPSAYTTKAVMQGRSPFMFSGADRMFFGNSSAANVGISSIYVQWNERQIPQRPYTVTDRNVGSCRMYEEYKRLCGDAGPCLTQDQYNNQYTVAYFDISRDGTGDEYAPGAADGTGSLTIVADLFPKGVAEPITMFVCAFGASHASVDAAGNVRRLMF